VCPRLEPYIRVALLYRKKSNAAQPITSISQPLSDTKFVPPGLSFKDDGQWNRGLVSLILVICSGTFRRFLLPKNYKTLFGAVNNLRLVPKLLKIINEMLCKII